MNKRLLAVIGCCLLSIPVKAFGQDNKITIGETVRIHSKLLNEDRNLMIYLPQEYANSHAGYPVIYLLDGDDHFIHTAGIVQFLTRQRLTPSMIIVGIVNTDRSRDLTPPTSLDTTNQFPTAGGADTFLKFITSELTPFIETHYRTAPYKILIGHSFGGLFAVHTLLNKPETFNAYIAISPSLWWNGQSEVGASDKFFATHPSLKSFLYMALGSEGDQMQLPAQAFTRILEKTAPKNFEWKFTSMPNEDHGSIPHRATYDGLELLFKGWRYTMSPADSDLAGIEKHYAGLSEKYGYRIEIPESSINSLGYQHLGAKRIVKAITVFKSNVKKYPESANVYDSLGDGYEANGQLAEAKEVCEKACALGKKSADPNLSAYEKHLENVKKKLEKK